MKGTREQFSSKLWPLKKDTSQDYGLPDRNTSEDHVETAANNSPTQYRTYKRRWFGLVQLALMNIVVSWDVRIFACKFLLIYPN